MDLFLFEATALMNLLYGTSDFTSRLVPVILGMMIVITGLSLKKMSKSEIHQVHCGDDNYSDNPRSHR